MLKIYSFLLFFIVSFNLHAIDTKAEQAVVIDFDTNEVLFEKNSSEKVIPASMTKIMTVYVAFDRIENSNLSLKSLCRVSAKARKMKGSRTFLEMDEDVTIETLLKGIIVQSGNDASVALAECLSGTEADFAKLMNFYAKELGMFNSNFKNSSGWPHPDLQSKVYMDDHYSSVYDLAILSNAMIKNFPNLYKYFSMKEFTYNDVLQKNRNKLLEVFEGTDGLKTGFTKESGWGIAATALRNKRRITVVVNGTNGTRSRLNETTNLLNWAFNQTSQTILVDENQIIKQVDVWLGNQPKVNLISSQKIISTLSFDQIQLMQSSIEYTKPIAAPIKSDVQYGRITIKIDGKPDIVVPLFAEKEISKVNPFLKIIAAAKYLLFGTSLNEN